MKQMTERIEQLKKNKNVVALAHFYVEDKVQDIADYIGDSYYLSKIATDTPRDTALFCGVRFMGKSAKILSPDKTVLTADCPMAHMITPEDITEPGAMYRLKTQNSDKGFDSFEQLGVCKILHTLETFDNRAEMPKKLRKEAQSALVRMREFAQ